MTKEEREAFLRQWESVQEFFARGETNREGDFAGTFNNYCNLQEFEELFREHFRKFLANETGQEAQRKALSTKVRRWKSNPFRGLHFRSHPQPAQKAILGIRLIHHGKIRIEPDGFPIGSQQSIGNGVKGPPQTVSAVNAARAGLAAAKAKTPQ